MSVLTSAELAFLARMWKQEEEDRYQEHVARLMAARDDGSNAIVIDGECEEVAGQKFLGAP